MATAELMVKIKPICIKGKAWCINNDGINNSHRRSMTSNFKSGFMYTSVHVL